MSVITTNQLYIGRRLPINRQIIPAMMILAGMLFVFLFTPVIKVFGSDQSAIERSAGFGFGWHMARAGFFTLAKGNYSATLACSLSMVTPALIYDINHHVWSHPFQYRY
jgi:tetrahydromethanopterin S-methyltransferase subunit C